MYEWLKAFHVIAVIAWMAGLLYLPRLFVYHADAPVGSPQSETFKTMERRLHAFIMRPAMIATWGFGLYLAITGRWFLAPWLHAKLALVILMSGLDGYLGRCVRNFAADRNPHGARFYRILNEVPTLMMIAVVILVVVKPF